MEQRYRVNQNQVFSPAVNEIGTAAVTSLTGHRQDRCCILIDEKPK